MWGIIIYLYTYIYIYVICNMYVPEIWSISKSVARMRRCVGILNYLEFITDTSWHPGGLWKLCPNSLTSQWSRCAREPVFVFALPSLPSATLFSTWLVQRQDTWPEATRALWWLRNARNIWPYQHLLSFLSSEWIGIIQSWQSTENVLYSECSAGVFHSCFAPHR